ncbi:MAG: type II toxin-antitoxin system VapC family toxin [Ignavibacteria bacterium]|nr:type II toxin-antitoxin system VapC family toxin [Ignavibacteria bacterium]
MRKLRIYIDTSVIGGCFDKEFAEWSNVLFDEFMAGKKIAVISDLTISELELAPDKVKNKIDEIPASNLIKIDINQEIISLANKYIEYKAVSKKFIDDATHIAAASLNNVNILVSWNFKHIVNYNRIKLYNSINMMMGYPLIEVRTPREVIDYEH